MLLLSNEEIDSFLSFASCIDALERAYRSWAERRAINRPRSDLYVPSRNEAGAYAFKTMEAGIADPPVVALRLNSDVIRWRREGDRVVKEKVPAAPGGKWVGLVLLFSAETGEPLAIFPDGVVQRARVAASSALAARYLAREDAATLAIFGSGWQAGAHVRAMCAVRRIERVRVYSPTREHREAFADAMRRQTGADVRAVDRPEAAVEGAEIIVAATNAITRVVHPDWLAPGVHVTCVKDCELGDETIRRADRLAIHSRKHAPDNYIAGLGDEKIEAHDPLDALEKGERAPREAPFWTAAPELKDLVAGRVAGRSSDGEITCFVNNIGLGIQFAALGALVLSEARARGLGRELPTEWFLESVHP